MAKRILIVEDEPNIRELLSYNLKASGYDILEACDGIEGIMLIQKGKPDLIILDIMIPKKDGFEVCKEIRAEGIDTPVIMLTAKAEEKDKIGGLGFGADDYITKPFSVEELKARIEAVLRRYFVEKIENNVITICDIKIDCDRYIVSRGGKNLDFTSKEFEIFAFLAKNRGKLFNRDELLSEVWGVDYLGESRTIDVHIRNIRKKITEGDRMDIITTMWGKGYKIDC